MDWDESPGAPAWIAWAVVAGVPVRDLPARCLPDHPGTRAQQARGQGQDFGHVDGTDQGHRTRGFRTDPGQRTHDVRVGRDRPYGRSVSDRRNPLPPRCPAPHRPDHVDGTQVTFGGENLIDGDPETAWRQSGDATGSTITLRFPQEVDVTSARDHQRLGEDHHEHQRHRLRLVSLQPSRPRRRMADQRRDLFADPDRCHRLPGSRRDSHPYRRCATAHRVGLLAGLGEPARLHRDRRDRGQRRRRLTRSHKLSPRGHERAYVRPCAASVRRGTPTPRTARG